METLFEAYDRDPVGALTVALQAVLQRDGASWPELLDDERLASRRASLAAREVGALDTLLRDLNELRQLPPR